jgi:hypothetical protein
MVRFIWDPEIESIPHSLDINPFRFAVNHPSREQFDEFNYNIGLEDACDFIDYPDDDMSTDEDLDNYTKIYNKYVNQYNNENNNRREMYIIYNNTIINPITRQPKVLGGLFLQFLDGIFEDGNGVSYVIMYVEYRCSFGTWKNLKKDMNKLIADTHKITGNQTLKPNIGDLMSRYIDAFGRKYAYDNKANHCVIFNYSLDSAIKYHLNQGWKPDAHDIMSRIYLVKNDKLTKKTAITIVNESGIGFVSGFQQMYKIV